VRFRVGAVGLGFLGWVEGWAEGWGFRGGAKAWAEGWGFSKNNI